MYIKFKKINELKNIQLYFKNYKFLIYFERNNI